MLHTKSYSNLSCISPLYISIHWVLNPQLLHELLLSYFPNINFVRSIEDDLAVTESRLQVAIQSTSDLGTHMVLLFMIIIFAELHLQIYTQPNFSGFTFYNCWFFCWVTPPDLKEIITGTNVSETLYVDPKQALLAVLKNNGIKPSIELVSKLSQFALLLSTQKIVSQRLYSKTWLKNKIYYFTKIFCIVKCSSTVFLLNLQKFHQLNGQNVKTIVSLSKLMYKSSVDSSYLKYLWV